ncbi:MAG: FAD-dependent oxidoreductase, partial [Tistlia sp.]
GSRNMTRLAKYSVELYGRLEAETGVATGLRQNGSISLALTAARAEELRRSLALARAFDIEGGEIGAAEVKRLYPHLMTDDVVTAVHLPGDGQCDPANVAMALASGARRKGARILEGVRVTGVEQAGGRVTGVSWQRDGEGEGGVGEGGERGRIATDIVINCAGMWARALGAAAGVTIPLHACEHFYLVTEPIAGLGRLPVLRVPDECAYYKEDSGKLMFGAFEPKAKPWGMAGIPEDFCFDQLPEDFEHFEPILEQGVRRMPLLASAGIHTFFNGPESFTPDDRYYLGEAPALRGYWVAAGYNSVGIVSSGGAGYALAQWLDSGSPPFDLWEVDIRRAQPFQANRAYLKERVAESLGLLYADHFPYRQPATARGVRRSPLHQQLEARGAVFGETAGWERANWFAEPGQERAYRYSWQRQNWFNNARREHLAVRRGVGLFDLSSFGKIRVEGRDAAAFLERLCANRVAREPGRVVYTQMLNERGGIESDLTVSRLSETAFLLVVPAATLQRDLAWLRRGLGPEEAAVITDVTAGEAVLALMGPQARAVLAGCSPNDFSNEAHPFGTWREIEIGWGLARAHRVSYVGELGWELYVSAEQAAHVFEALEAAGQAHGLALCGLHALDSCRLEKGFRHFGHDVSDEDHVLEAGLGFAVSSEKDAFVGREAVLRKREAGLERRLVQFRLSDPEPLLYHNEPILRDGRTVGILTSGAYGHFLGAAVGMGWVPCKGESAEALLASTYEIDVAGRRVAAEASLKPFYDPGGARLRG